MSQQPPPGGGPYGGDPYGSYGYLPPPPRPGVVPLAPLDLGGIVAGAFGTWRRHWRLVLSLSAVAALVVAVAGIPLDRLTFPTPDGPGAAAAPSAAQVGAALTGGLVATSISLLAWAVVSGLLGGLLAVLGHRATLGRPATWSQTWQRVRPHALSLVGLSLVVNVVAGVGLLFCVAPGVILYTFWSLAIPAMVTERLGVGRAIGRSYRLVLGDAWRIFGVLLVVSLATLLVTLAIGMPLTVPGVLAADPGSASLLPTLGGFLSGTITMAALPLVSWFLYLDQRIRRERYDVQLFQEAGDPGA